MSNLQLRIISAVVLVVAVLAVTWLGGCRSACSASPSPARSSTNGARMSRDRDRRGATRLVAASAARRGACSRWWPGYSARWRSRSARRCRCWPRSLDGRLAGRARWDAGGLAYAGAVRPVAGLAARRRPGRPDRHPVPVRRGLGDRHPGLFRRPRRSAGRSSRRRSRPARPGAARSAARSAACVAGVALAALAGLRQPARRWRWSRCCCRSSSQVGDLFESWVKRRHGVKDSSQLIPGPWRRHGPGRRACRGRLCPIRHRRLLGSADNPAQGLFGGLRWRQPRRFARQSRICRHWGDTCRGAPRRGDV